MSLMTDLQSGSQLLLSYFHVTIKGKPFTKIKWREPKSYRMIAKLFDEQIILMDDLSRSLKEHNMGTSLKNPGRFQSQSLGYTLMNSRLVVLNHSSAEPRSRLLFHGADVHPGLEA